MLLRRRKRSYIRAVENTAPVHAIDKPIEKEELVIKEEKVQNEPIIYTRTIINRMNVEALKELSLKSGLEIGEGESGASMKRRLIDLLVV